MSYFKIPGHSGTSFKHKRYFQFVKSKYNWKYNPDINCRIGKKAPGKKINSIPTSLWIKRLRILTALVFLIIPTFTISAIYIGVTGKRSKPIQSKTKLISPDYETLISCGNFYLKKGNVSKAQYEFTLACRLFPSGHTARIGLLKCLYYECVLNSKYCEFIEENQDYLLRSKFKSKDQLESIKQEMFYLAKMPF